MTSDKSEIVSVIIPSYNSENTIEKCIRALINQSYKGKYEIILADSSDDNTQQIVKQKFPAVKLITFDKKTDPGTARNTAVKMSKGELILFIDSDCIAAPDWIEKYAGLHSQTDHAAIGGGVFNGNNPRNQVAWAGYLAEFREYIPERAEGEVEHIPTCNISYKAAVFKSLPGFNPDYYPQEDLEFNYRLRKSGHRIWFCPDINVYHNHRTELHSFFIHQKRVGNITSRMLNILPLQGANIARSKFLSAILLPILPVFKWLNTLFLFIRLNPGIILRHIPAVLIFALGLVPWTIGFYSGVLSSTKEVSAKNEATGCYTYTE